ncbi:unnamed protein product [Lactuca virosa]|uniref:O-acyltransferase WSD1 C-terminal domain-containing protein n=1 Tax=Lactuca virosa TaxID=75947 RepID=A0AAU9MGR3_9ASTR|nr:unnamed protein product [Lactuca virosa]
MEKREGEIRWRKENEKSEEDHLFPEDDVNYSLLNSSIIGDSDSSKLENRRISRTQWRWRKEREIRSRTINDVLFGVISSGLSRYLDDHSPKPIKEGLRITGAAMVNLRPSQGLQEFTELMKSGSKSRWGNKFALMLLPIYYHTNGSDPLQYLKRAKMMIDRKKFSLEAFLSYKIGCFIMKCLGPKRRVYDCRRPGYLHQNHVFKLTTCNYYAYGELCRKGRHANSCC